MTNFQPAIQQVPLKVPTLASATAYRCRNAPSREGGLFPLPVFSCQTPTHAAYPPNSSHLKPCLSSDWSVLASLLLSSWSLHAGICPLHPMKSSSKGQHNLPPTKCKPSFKALSGVFFSQTLTKASLTPILHDLFHGSPVQSPVSLNFLGLFLLVIKRLPCFMYCLWSTLDKERTNGSLISFMQF